MKQRNEGRREMSREGGAFRGALPNLTWLSSPDWTDYALLDSGGGLKLEKFGPYSFIRPEPQAMWDPARPKAEWDAAHGLFVPTGEESGGHWDFRKPVEPNWTMRYKGLRFRAHAINSRHMGVFPEQAAHWDWMADRIRGAGRPVQVLNLFAYTGLATVAVAHAGAKVTHVDALKSAVNTAHENQSLSGLDEHSIRWIVDDAVKFVRREGRRGTKYDGIILDPPKFGRGPTGEVWEFFEKLPDLLRDCRAVLSDRPGFVVLTAYAIRASALSLYYLMQEIFGGLGGEISIGELVTLERSGGRALSQSLFARWSAE